MPKAFTLVKDKVLGKCKDFQMSWAKIIVFFKVFLICDKVFFHA